MVALQTFRRDHWFSCWASHTHCHAAICGGTFFSGTDWTNCRGESFQIYRARGSGALQVGDLVGVHYPHTHGTWLGCPGNECDRQTCPGNPTLTHGFSSDEKWHTCGGEVFKIYAYGKNLGSTINNGDLIMLYYLAGGLWVAQGYGNTIKLPCPGTVRPPPRERYDACAWESFIIVKR